MKTQSKEETAREQLAQKRPTITRGGKLPVITAGSGDLGTPNGIIN